MRHGALIGEATLGYGDDGAIPWFAVHDDELGPHVRAWKVAWQVRGSGGVEFFPLTSDTPYGVDSAASCAEGCGSTPPNLDCSCGFYACLAHHDATHLASLILPRRGRPPFGDPMVATLLEVALSGKVAVFEGPRPGSGGVVRAQHQRIVNLEIAPSWHRGDEGGTAARRSVPLQPGSGPERMQVPTPDWPASLVGGPLPRTPMTLTGPRS